MIAAPLAVLTTAVPAHSAIVDVQILGTNDFHGRLLPNGGEAGAAQFAGAVAQLEAAHTTGPTIFAAAGDLIGASTFESFIQHDRPTLQALNAAGLDVSSAGNHEFDQGYSDFVDRVMKAYDATTNPEGGADWQYIAANVRKKAGGGYALPDVTPRTPDPADSSDGGTWVTTVGGAKIGFIGGVTEELPSLVSPSGIADLQVTSIVNETNAAADRLKAEGADMVVLLVHEGAPDQTLASATSNDNAFGRIVNGVDSDVSAIISGHTHLAYKHVINGRPVVSAGQYGTNLNQLVFNVNTDTNAVSLVTNEIVPAATLALDSQVAKDKKTEVAAIVKAAQDKADVLGAVEVGKISGPFQRALLASGAENRGGESTVGNLIAEVQRWATSSPEAGAAQIAVINPGGIRDDLLGLAANGYPATVTYKQVAVVQSFANTLVNMKMTGAQIKTMLEQQWQRLPDGTVPTRNYLRLGTSKGFYSTFDATRPEGDRITGMWLNGKAIEPATSYSVTANSFLASGGDNFRVFNQATGKRDTGKVDLQAMVDYFAATKGSPVQPDYQQHFVGVTWPADKPRFYRIGERVQVGLSSLIMSGKTDPRDARLLIKAGDVNLRKSVVDATLPTVLSDDHGKSQVAVRLKGKTETGKQQLTFTGQTTGSTFSLPIDVRKALAILKARTKPERIVTGETRTRLKIKAEALGINVVTGRIVVKAGGQKYKVKLVKGKAFVRLDRFAKAGTKRIVVKYKGSDNVRRTAEVIKLKVHRS